MKKILIIPFILLSLLSVAQTPDVIKFPELQRIMESNNDTTYVINFWATWCVPCVKEFPAFQALARAHQHEKVKVVMVSLDFKKGMQQTIVPFVKKNPIDGTVVLLDEPDYNSWLDKVSKEWQGEIPVTIMINNAKKIRTFFNHDFTKETLEESLNKTIKQ
jgi:thiol-disulfide isomerase/thioredoxin